MLELFDNPNTRRILWGLLVVLTGLIPVVTVQPYYTHILTVTLVWVVLSQGLNLIQGFTGYISLAQATFMGVGAYVSGLAVRHLEVPVFAGMLLGVLAAGLVGFFLSVPALRTKGHYFAITTMALSVVATIIMRNWRSVTGGTQGLPGVPRPAFAIGPLDLSSRQGYFYFCLIMAVLVTLFIARLKTSRYGRAFMAIRESEQLAWAVGVDIQKFKTISFTVSAMVGGISGGMYAHFINFVNPSPFDLANSLNAILAVILGGSGTVLGPILGSTLIVFVPEYLRVADAYRLVIYGVMLIAIVVFLPRGIVGWAERKLEGKRLAVQEAALFQEDSERLRREEPV